MDSELPSQDNGSDGEHMEKEPLLNSLGRQKVVHQESSFHTESDHAIFTLETEAVGNKNDVKSKIWSILQTGKVIVLFILVGFLIVVFMAHPHNNGSEFLISVRSDGSSFKTPLANLNKSKFFETTLLGPFPGDEDKSTDNLILTFNEISDSHIVNTWSWILPIIENGNGTMRSCISKMNVSEKVLEGSSVELSVQSTASYEFGLGFSYKELGSECKNVVLYAAMILFGLYVLIVFELVHRTVAAMLAALAAMATLASINKPPTLHDAVAWIDFDTLALLFGMMVMVSVFAETGFFDWVAVKAYKLAKGKTWRLVTILCVVAGVVSAFLDNVTTILLMTPLTIRLCEVMGLDTRLVLIAEVIFSNIGGAATGIGDPPNVIIISNPVLQDRYNINFGDFTLHLSLGIIFCSLTAYAYVRFALRHLEDHAEAPEIVALRKEVVLWTRTAARIQPATASESLVQAMLLQKASETENELNRTQNKHRKNKAKNWQENLVDLENKYVIKDYWLLAKTVAILAVAIILFFIHSQIGTNIGWIAVLCALSLLVLADIQDVERVMDNVEWATLVFFAGLFVLMEALNELGLIAYVGELIISVLKHVDDKNRLTVGIVAIVWISGIASAFIDNIPFTTAMVPVIIKLAENSELALPIEPLVWSLAFGGCLGGNGTLIAASANVVCAGQAEQHGYKISFLQFFKIGFPTMLVTLCTATVYLLICHSALHWHNT